MKATISRVTTLSLTTAVAIIIASTPAAASHDSLNCTTPSSFEPLLGLLDSLVELAFIAGIGLGTLGFLVAALFLMLPGQDNSRRGKLVAKNVFIGAVLLLSAQLIVDFLVVQLGATLCS
jgi:hypothetical protein